MWLEKPLRRRLHVWLGNVAQSPGTVFCSSWGTIQLVSKAEVKMIIDAIVSSHLDYCKGIFLFFIFIFKPKGTSPLLGRSQLCCTSFNSRQHKRTYHLFKTFIIHFKSFLLELYIIIFLSLSDSSNLLVLLDHQVSFIGCPSHTF